MHEIQTRYEMYIQCVTEALIFVESKFGLHQTKTTGRLHGHLQTFMMSHYIFPGRRNFSNKRCRGNQNTNFMSNKFPKITPLTELQKIQCNQPGLW